MSTMPDAADADERTISELRAMDREEARQQLTVAEFEKWESVNDHLDEHAEATAEWEDTRAVATDIMVRADVSDLAADVTVFGNDLTAYFAPDDEEFRAMGERLGESFGVDIEEVADDPDSAEGLSTDDLDEEKLDEVNDLLADFIIYMVQSWDGHDWDELRESDRQAVRAVITDDPPQGWGIAGAMDAWVEIVTAVEANRNDRLERIQKFRSAERRGDR